MNIKFSTHFRKFLYGLMIAGLALSTLGASLPSAVRPASPAGAVKAAPSASGACLTQVVTITLASEQVSFCSPTSLPVSVVEDGSPDAFVGYAGLAQRDGFGSVNIKATVGGKTPGVGRPVYTPGGVVAYRQTVRDMETARDGRVVSSGPTGLFWDETVPGMQVDLTLPTSAGDLKVRSIEWYVEHNHRLWSFIMTWDTGLPTASDWEAASRNISVQKTVGENLADTAIDLSAIPESPAGGEILGNGAPVTVSAPSWWDGTCDTNNYYPATGVHAIKLYKWLGVTACGPVPTTDYLVHFYAGAVGQYEFQSVELVMRFLYLEWNIAPWAGVANTIKNSLPASMVFYANDGSHKLVTGDILTEDASAQNPTGHSMVVIGVTLDANRNGTVQFMEQNASTAGQRTLNVVNGVVQPDAFVWGQTIQGWLHYKSNQDDGDFDPTFTPGTGPNGRVNAIALKANGRIQIAGNFTSYDGTSINRVARLNTDGTLDTSFNAVGVGMTGGTPHINSLVVYPADAVYAGEAMIGGHFDTYNGITHRYIARLKSDGSLDSTFKEEAVVDNDVYSIAIQPDGKILAGGTGTLRRMTATGNADSGFFGTMDGNVFDILLQADGKIIIGGDFSKVDGVARAGIARLNGDGTLDTGFDPGTGTGVDAVNSISLDPEGKILIGGDFTTFNGTSRNRVARLNSNGSLDLTFNPGTGVSKTFDYVNTIFAQSDGRILMGGSFTLYNGATVGNIVRLNYDGSLDTTFYPNIDGVVHALLEQPDGKIIISGSFTNRIARLLNTIKSCYSLTTAVSPAAGGSITVNTAPNCLGNRYLAGTQVQVTVVLNPNYQLVNWSGDASGSANPLILTMDSNKSVTANLMTPPAAFTKVAPANTATGQPASLTLLWGTSTGASSYEYCLDLTNNNTCDSGTWVTTGTGTSAALSSLLPSVSYYWQVRARNVAGTTEAGPWWSFSRNGIPASPLTVSPNGLISDHQPAYVWNASNGASSYRLQVVNLNDLLTYLVDTDVDSSACLAGVCTYRPAVELPAGDYEFRVSATAAGTSESSAWRTFTVGLAVYLPLIIR